MRGPLHLLPAVLWLLAGCSSVDSGGRPDAELAAAHYLKGSAALSEERYDEAVEHFEQALAIDPHDRGTLARLGQIHFLREEYPEAIRRFEAALGGRADAELLGWLARCRFAQHRYREAGDLARRALARDPSNLVAWLQLVAALRETGEDRLGAAACRRALAQFDEAPAELLRRQAYFLTRLGRAHEAEPIYRGLLARSRWLAGEEDVRRLALVQLGRYRDALGAWRAKGTSWVVDRPGNRLAERFGRLDRAAGDAERRPSAGALHALGRAFEQVGWLACAELVLRRARSADALRGVTAARRMVERVRGALYEGYRAHLRGERAPSLERILQQVEQAGRPAGLGPLRPSEEISSIGLLYRYVEPGSQTRSRVVRWFRERGMLFLLFDFYGPVEGNLKNLLYWDPAARRRLWGREIEYELAICEKSQVRHFREYQAHHSYGGLTLSPHGFWLDVETYARIAHQVLGGFRRARGMPGPQARIGRLKARLAYRIARAAADELPGGADPLERDRRLAERLTRWLLDAAEYHELGHVELQRRYLPAGANVLRGLGLLFQERFSADKISIWSERQAQLTSLVHAARPLVALYRTVASITRNPRRSRHAQAYREILDGLIRLVRADARRYPNLDPRRDILSQLDRLTGDQVRELARRLY